MEDQKTQLYEAMDIGDPVQSFHDLPKDATEGQSRYVKEESAVYSFRKDRWVKEIYKRG